MLEGSKDFAKEFMSKYNIPTAQSKSFTLETISEGIGYLKNHIGPYVLKADGPAAGKGVVIVDKFNEAKAVLEDMLLNKSFGKSSETVVIEEFLSGIEMSCFVLFDGKNYLTLPMLKITKELAREMLGLIQEVWDQYRPYHLWMMKCITKLKKDY